MNMDECIYAYIHMYVKKSSCALVKHMIHLYVDVGTFVGDVVVNVCMLFCWIAVSGQ